MIEQQAMETRKSETVNKSRDIKPAPPLLKKTNCHYNNKNILPKPPICDYIKIVNIMYIYISTRYSQKYDKTTHKLS